MLVIRGDIRVADIYLGEFMRQFSSCAFRDAALAASQAGSPQEFKPQDLATDASWIARYSQPGSGNHDVYIFRRFYNTGDGIHDTHMNQGSTKGFVHRPNDDNNDHNDVWQDGAVMVNTGQAE